MYKPRPYQQTAVDKAVEFFESNSRKRPVIVAPTGSGKSIMIAFITHHLKRDVLVLQPSKELLEQNHEKFTVSGGEAKIFSASVGKKEIGKVTFATIGSIKKIPDQFLQKNYVIIDECDAVPPAKGSMYMQFLSELLASTKVLGFTATPFRNKKYLDHETGEQYTKTNLLLREKPRFFNEFLHIIQISEMYEMGYLCPVKWIQIDWNGYMLQKNSTGAEYSDRSIEKAMDQNQVIAKLPGIIKQALEKGRKHVLVFVKTITDAEYMTKIVPNSGYVHSKTTKRERIDMLNKFKAGEIKVMFNVGILTVGFDFPALDTIILGRPTMSLRLYMQMVGRGIRLHDGKENCAVVDMCGNYNRFGPIEDIKLVEEENAYTLKTEWVLRNGDKVLTGVPLEF